jgi:hypothetical protein
MAEPDFDGLRTEVEAATRLPEFASVTRRARRVRRRIFGRRLILSLVTLGVVLPTGIGAVYLTPRQSTVQGGGADTQIGLEPPEVATPTPTPSTAPVATIRAIAGSRLGSLYAAIDVCRPGDGTTRCSLQIVPLGTTAQDQREPIATDELRANPSDSLTDVTLLALTPTSLLLSGIRPDGERKSRRINVNGGGAEIAPERVDATEPDTGDLVVQLRRYGELSFVRQIDSRAFRLRNQPPIKEFTLVTSIPPARGWWVTGLDPVSGGVAVAVSRDLGQTWQVRSLGLRPGMGDPVLTTGDGRTVFLFLRSSTGIQQRRSTDGGLTWETLATPMPWPSMGSADVVTRRLGAVVRGDGSLLVWVEDAPGAVFLESPDAGLSYRPASGPSGPIVAVQDGFVALSDPPTVSRDGHTWSALPRPAILLPS